MRRSTFPWLTLLFARFDDERECELQVRINLHELIPIRDQDENYRYESFVRNTLRPSYRHPRPIGWGEILRKIERLQHGLHGDIKRLREAEAAYRLRMGDREFCLMSRETLS